MEKISISLPSEQVRRLEDMVGTECDNRSEAARKTIEKGFEHDELDISHQALSERLRRANKSLVTSALATIDNEDEASKPES